MSVEDGKPILDLDNWRAGSPLDRAAWSLAAGEELLSVLRDYLGAARRGYYRPADPNDWSVPNMERYLARAEEVVAGQSDADYLAFTQAVAAFFGAMPPEMAEDMRRGTMR